MKWIKGMWREHMVCLDRKEEMALNNCWYGKCVLDTNRLVAVLAHKKITSPHKVNHNYII